MRSLKRLVESFYRPIDDMRPSYPKLIVKEEVKENIIEKTGGFPIVAKLFFDQKASQGRTEITYSDVEGITSNTVNYALIQVFNYYLPMDNCQ